MTLKLDMGKAYDWVEWGFLEEIMKWMGFEARWVHLIMTCVKTISYSILINGQPHVGLFPLGGLGKVILYHLTYFFFSEGLSTLLHNAEQNNLLSGLPIIQRGIKINHLLFAEDSLMFCRANLIEWNTTRVILEIYENASGQKINRDKTFIFFSKNTKSCTREQILTASGVSSTSCYEKYLGLPALVGRSQTRYFNNIQSQIWDRLNGWKEKFLSQAGKEVLLKEVIQAIPIYTISVFQLPNALCNKLNSLMSKFW